MAPNVGQEFVYGSPPTTGGDRALGLVDFAMFPHLDHEAMPDHSMANAEQWAAGMPVPGYAIDDRDRHQSDRRHRRSRLRGALEAVHPRPGCKLVGLRRHARAAERAFTDVCSLLKQTRQQARARKASWISCAAVVADEQSFELVQPGEGALDDPAVAAEAGAVLGLAAGDLGLDPALPELAAVLVVVVAAVGGDAARAGGAAGRPCRAPAARGRRAGSVG